MPMFDPNNYADVQLRINRFYDMYPEGSIVTMLASSPDDWKICRYRAEVRRVASNAWPDATGYAFEVAGGGGANKTSHEENCETSAIGRALANLGKHFAKDATDRPSRQEMDKVSRFAEEVPFDGPAHVPQAPSPNGSAPKSVSNPAAEATDKQLEYIVALCEQLGLKDESGAADTAAIGHVMISEFNMSWPDITRGEANAAIDTLKARKAAGQRFR